MAFSNLKKKTDCDSPQGFSTYQPNFTNNTLVGQYPSTPEAPVQGSLAWGTMTHWLEQ